MANLKVGGILLLAGGAAIAWYWFDSTSKSLGFNVLGSLSNRLSFITNPVGVFKAQQQAGKKIGTYCNKQGGSAFTKAGCSIGGSISHTWNIFRGTVSSTSP
jgi:hypothetical protein